MCSYSSDTKICAFEEFDKLICSNCLALGFEKLLVLKSIVLWSRRLEFLKELGEPKNGKRRFILKLSYDIFLKLPRQIGVNNARSVTCLEEPVYLNKNTAPEK